ncbi:MAG: hypothetical protein WCX61_01835 [Candidatus Peribacteraceae bacterium]|jgi:hypothetical protein
MIRFFRTDMALVWGAVLLLTAGLGVSFIGLTPSPDRDFFFYQAFVESLASGTLDLSIPGFHGSNIFAVPLYWITHSSLAEIELQMIYAILLPVSAYLAGASLFRSRWYGLVLAGIVTMSPFVSMISGIGYTAAGYWVLMLITLYGAGERKWWTGIAWGLAILTKPFALALLPVLWIYRPEQGSLWKRHHIILLGLTIPVLAALFQYVQAGHVIVGVHPELNEASVWQEPMKILLNAAYALQILFSVHNYHYPNPGGTGHENLLHTTPLLMFLGIFALIAQRQYFTERKLPAALLIGAILGFGMNAVVATMNEYYMQAGMLLLILAALPVLKKYPLWIPFVLATLHFQWFYFFLAFGERLHLITIFFAAPIVVDMLFVIWFLQQWRWFLRLE